MNTVGYLGPENTYTHLAALSHFSKKARYIHAPTIEDVFRLVEREEVDAGVVPVENSLEGAVAHTLDRFIDFRRSPVKICGEIELSIQHALILHTGIALESIAVVYSHPQALAQCDSWLRRNLPTAHRMETASTAEAVNRVISSTVGSWGLRERAAIARKEALKKGLKAISIPNERMNKTRFLILGLNASKRAARIKTSVLFALKDQPGALHDALAPFRQNNINLSKIESRPSKQEVWKYLFFVDFVGHESSPKAQKALRALKARTAFVKVLGSYPSAR